MSFKLPPVEHSLDKLALIRATLQSRIVSGNENDFTEGNIKIDELLADVYNDYARFYYAALEHRRREAKAQSELISLQLEFDKLKKENEKLLNSLQWDTK